MDNGCCSSCHLALHEPFVRCRVCAGSEHADVCLECFSRGREFGRHRNSHRYTIVCDTFSLIDDDWTADEEQQLLEGLLRNGEGNWDEICRSVPNKTPGQCRSHFERVYIDDGARYPLFPAAEGRADRRADRPVAFSSGEESAILVRPEPRSQLHKDLAGYNAARGDFDWESDNLAEMELNSIEASDIVGESCDERGDLDNVALSSALSLGGADENDACLHSALSMGALSIYNTRLRRRVRRKRVVRELGLIDRQKGVLKDRTYRLVSRLVCAFDTDFIVEGLRAESELREQILRLQDYRRNGLTHPLAAAFYTKLKREREADASSASARPSFLDMLRQQHLSLPASTRKTAGPLDIVGLPAYDKLTDEERDLCSVNRVLPQVFIDVKHVLVEECRRASGLRLADARPLVKIDVNKTRKLYDFLLKKQLIHAPNL